MPTTPVSVALDEPPSVVEGAVGAAEEKTYLLLPFVIPEGATRVEVGYSWEPEVGTVLDLGLWDEHGYRSAEGFRGWSGSRHARRHQHQGPVWVGSDDAERCYRAGPVRPGVWWVELGVGAVGPDGARFRVEVGARRAATGPPPAPDPVDAGHVARAEPGWYHGDFHQHGYHSNPSGPDWERLVVHSRAASLDVLPVVEYVVPWHWDQLGAVARANPDLLFWPGREVITYFGHAVVLGETPGLVEYRHGFEDVHLGGIQAEAVAHGALFQVAHPTTYPEDDYPGFCRGCEFRLGDDIDWALVDTLEVVTGPVALGDPAQWPNPFTETAIDLWHEHLRAGHRLTAVSGSDDKFGPDYGITATAVWAEELSRVAIRDALRAGHAYVRARGVEHSPALELVAARPDGTAATFGDTIVADRAELELTVRGAAGQVVRVLRDGTEVDRVAVRGDDVRVGVTAERVPTSGPLGTFWGFEVRDDVSLTALANPVFLGGGSP